MSDTKDSRKSRMKKNLASKMAGSKAGRTVIVNALGEEGAEIVGCIKSLVGLYKDHKTSKEFKANVFKFAMKAQIMFADKKIDNDPVKEKTIIAAAVMFLYALRDQCGPSARAGIAPDLDTLIPAFDTMKENVLFFMSPHMKPENTKLLDETLSTVCDRGFVNAVLTNPDYHEDRELLYQNMESLLQPVDCTQYVDTPTKDIEIRFDDQYSSAIEFVQNFWVKSLKGKEPELGKLIIDNLVAKNADYADYLPNCKHGADPDVQQKELAAFVHHIVKCLSAWTSFLQKELAGHAKEHKVWAPNMPKNAYEDLRVAISESVKELVGAKFTRGVERSYNVVSKIVIQQFLSCYTE